MLTKLKARFQRFIANEARLMHRAGFKPNMVSFLGALLGLSSGIAYWAAGSSSADPTAWRVYMASASLLLLLSGFCDALDGALARLYGGVTPFGGFLDSLLDRYVDSAVLLGLIIGGLCPPIWGILALIGSLLTSYARARSEAAGVAMESVGVIERAERMAVIFLSSMVHTLWPGINALGAGVIFLAVASNLTVLQRTLHFYKRVAQRRV